LNNLNDIAFLLYRTYVKYPTQVTTTSTSIPITPDQIQPKYWSMDSEWVTTGTLIGRLIEFYSTETANVLKRW